MRATDASQDRPPSKETVLAALQDKISIYYERELQSVKWNGNKGIALCPFHEDTKPSLSVNSETGLHYCHGCGEKGSIFDFHAKKYGLSFSEALKELADFAGITETKKKKIIATYDYTDEAGNLIFQVVRYEPKGFSQRRPDGSGGHIYNLEGVTTVPYNLPEIFKAKTVFVGEGEQDCDTLKEIGIVATTNPMGAKKWKSSYNQYLKGKDIVILPDNDETGEKHAQDIANNLKGIAKTIKIVSLPDLPDKGDITDWLQMGRTKDELLNLVAKTEEWKREQSLWDKLPTGADLQKMDLHVEWVVEGLIPKQSITTLAGKGGTGKTSLVMGLMDAVTKGELFLGLATQQTHTLLVDFENSLSVDVERFRTLNITKVKVWHNANNPPPPRIDSADYKQYLSIPPCLIVFDSLRACQSGDENSSKDMALVMERFKELRDYGHHVVVIQHTQKANERMFRGSMAISDQADNPLYFYPVRNTKSNEAVEDDDFDELPFYLGTTEKTRYTHFKVYVKRAGKGRFVVADDPKTEKMKAIWELCKDKGTMKHEEIVTLVNEELDFGKVTVRKLLKDGAGKFWTWKKGDKNSKIYSFISPLTPSPYIRGEWISEQDSDSSSAHLADLKREREKTLDGSEFTNSSRGEQRTDEQDSEDDFIHEVDEQPEPPRFKGGAI